MHASRCLEKATHGVSKGVSAKEAVGHTFDHVLALRQSQLVRASQESIAYFHILIPDIGEKVQPDYRVDSSKSHGKRDQTSRSQPLSVGVLEGSIVSFYGTA